MTFPDDSAPAEHLPTPDVETAAFWSAAAEERFLLRLCDDCGRYHYYPRPFCPSCWSDAVSWVDACGQASVYTYSIVRRNDLPPFRSRLPYVAAVVRLAEGPLVSSTIEGCRPGDVYIDMPVVAAYRREGTITLPVFEPALHPANGWSAVPMNEPARGRSA